MIGIGINDGGGIYVFTGRLTLENCEVARNRYTSYDGGGICNWGGYVTMTNSQVHHNQASSDGGGGIALVNTREVRMTSCEIFENSGALALCTGTRFFVQCRDAPVRQLTADANL